MATFFIFDKQVNVTQSIAYEASQFVLYADKKTSFTHTNGGGEKIMGNNKHKNNKTQDNKKQQNQNQNANRERENREEFAEEVDFSRIQNEKNK